LFLASFEQPSQTLDHFVASHASNLAVTQAAQVVILQEMATNSSAVGIHVTLESAEENGNKPKMISVISVFLQHGSECSLGRESPNILIPASQGSMCYISRTHCRIFTKKESAGLMSVWLQDCSSNGTCVNNEVYKDRRVEIHESDLLVYPPRLCPILMHELLDCVKNTQNPPD
jgi:hypothetical protein